ncbi:MAG TPA: hypothetical protein VF532_03220 [Candidatus Angelobacter sp.]
MVITRAFFTLAFGIVLTIGLTCGGKAVQSPDGRVVLPNIELAGCDSLRCSLIWPDQTSAGNAAYPKHVSVDLDNNSIRAVMAIYDQSVTMDEIKAAVDQRYGQWALAAINPYSHMRLWRVEPEKFAISLFEDSNGTKQLFYFKFRPNSQVYQDMVNAMIQNYSDYEAAAHGQSIPRSTSESATVTNQVSRALVGKRITIHGTFSMNGKIAPASVQLDNHEVVYLRGSWGWGQPYSDMDGKRVSVTGYLGFYKSPPVKPTEWHVARLPDHYYFEPQTAPLRLIGP